MSLALTQRPIQDTIYRWNTSKNPLIYTFNTVSTGDNYRIQIQFYDITDTLLYPEPFTYTPKSDGSLLVDVSNIVLSLLNPIINVSALPQNDLSLLFYIVATEVSSAGSGDVVNDQSNPIGVFLAKNQFKENSNLRDYTPVVTQNSVGFTVNNQAKFLTRFEMPSMWVGWPNFISALANGDNTLTGEAKYLEQTPLDKNKSPLANPTNIDLTDIAVADRINNVRLNDNRLELREQFRQVSATAVISLLAVQTATATSSLLAAGAAQGFTPPPPVSLLEVASTL